MRDRDRGPVLFGNLRETPAPSSDEPAITGDGEPIHEASAPPNQQPVITVDARPRTSIRDSGPTASGNGNSRLRRNRDSCLNWNEPRSSRLASILTAPLFQGSGVALRQSERALVRGRRCR
jgi:hypothetical protein